MNILHPTDFSTAAEHARALALSLHDRLRGRLHVVHVQSSYDTGTNPLVQNHFESMSPSLREQLEQNRQDETRMLRERLASLASDGATHELRWGDPLAELLEISPQYDLVAMGAHGRSPFDRFFLGGVAGRFVRRSRVPVLTTRQGTTASEIRRVLVATDFGRASAAAWRFALRLADAGVDLAATHVLTDDADDATDRAVRRLEAFTDGVRARHVLRRGNPALELPRIADEVGADAILIGVRHHAGLVGMLLGSRADALLRSSTVPILSVPYVNDED